MRSPKVNAPAKSSSTQIESGQVVTFFVKKPATQLLLLHTKDKITKSNIVKKNSTITHKKKDNIELCYKHSLVYIKPSK